MIIHLKILLALYCLVVSKISFIFLFNVSFTGNFFGPFQFKRSQRSDDDPKIFCFQAVANTYEAQTGVPQPFRDVTNVWQGGTLVGHNKYKTLTLEGNKGSSVLLWRHEDSLPAQICISFHLLANWYFEIQYSDFQKNDTSDHWYIRKSIPAPRPGGYLRCI